MKHTIDAHDAWNYVEVFQVIEWKNGCVFKTKHKGFAAATRPKQDDEVYAPLSTKLLRQPKITLELIT